MVEQSQSKNLPKTLPDWHGDEDDSDYDEEDGDFEFGTDNQTSGAKPKQSTTSTANAAQPSAAANLAKRIDEITSSDASAS